MRAEKKEQAENFIKLLEQAHDGIRKTIEQKDFSNALKLLEDCQDGAIALGTMIEESEGEGFVTVSLLEEYCELTYQIHESIIRGGEVGANNTYKKLNSLLIKINNSVRNDITVRKEVVFLPYKASMWDSLESVWMAADDDPECDAYVVPIPYYDKNPDGSFREMHYEGEQYPEYVPVTWYEDYDFAARRPDMIFIHNPYDNCNYVTSVHPFFYSKNLKQYTDKLVYIPYFILSEIRPDDKVAIDEMKHFCITPGAVNADKVIVQSEDMRQVYINVLMEMTGGDDAGRTYWEEKILGLGSPKFDKATSTRVKDEDIPDEWQKIVRKPDGSKKKVILYNTSVSALLAHGEQMLQKIQSVFEVFKENINDAALLWRPHPLIKATISSMRPQLWNEYEKLVEKYREEGWGIYDDSAELDRAIALSDGYYGDPSSVVQLCLKNEIPVMVQTVKNL